MYYLKIFSKVRQNKISEFGFSLLFVHEQLIGGEFRAEPVADRIDIEFVVVFHPHMIPDLLNSYNTTWRGASRLWQLSNTSPNSYLESFCRIY